MNKDIDNPPTNDEHIAFLEMWLCRNIFYVLASKMTLQFIDITKPLTTCRPVSLGPMVLAHLYQAISIISIDLKEMNPNVPDPLWILQMWLHVHFHEISPPIVERTNIPFGQIILQADLMTHSIQDCFTFSIIARIVLNMFTIALFFLKTILMVMFSLYILVMLSMVMF